MTVRGESTRVVLADDHHIFRQALKTLMTREGIDVVGEAADGDEAVELTREDCWSPRESVLRLHIVMAGLPEPLLNQNVYDDHGRFLGCVDLAYPHLKVAIEYQSVLHHSRYSADVERIAALRAAGWTVIEVTSALLSRPEELVARIRQAIGL